MISGKNGCSHREQEDGKKELGTKTPNGLNDLRILTIDKESLVKALLDLAYAGAEADQYPWLVAIDHNRDVSRGRLIWVNKPSEYGGCFANRRGVQNYSPWAFLPDDPYLGFSWGGRQGSGPEGRTTAGDIEEARRWIEENLLPLVCFVGGDDYLVRYT